MNELIKAETHLPAHTLTRVDEHPAAVYIASLAPGSRRTMRQALDVIAELLSGGRADAVTLEWAALRSQHVAAARSALGERFASATANKALCALRGVLKTAWRLGQLSSEDYQRAADIPGIKGQALPAGRAVALGEIVALSAVCAGDRTASGTRDTALLAVLYAGGLRRSEVVGLDRADYDSDAGALSVRHGKGNKARVAYLTNGGKEALDAWIAIRGDEPGALFSRVRKGGMILGGRISPKAVTGILQRRARQSGVKRLSPHDMRRTFISNLLEAGADLSVVKDMAGHANIATTTRYDRRGESAKKKAATLLHFPYIAKKEMEA
jgi:site-specific recombinase XerD